MKTILILMVLLLVATGAAKEPKVGDLVVVQTDHNEYEGNITSIHDGMMCIAVRLFEGEHGWVCKDCCIGIGQIEKLSWIT